MLLDVRTHCRLTLPISSAKGQEKIGGGLFSVVFSVSLFWFAVFAFSSGASLAGPIWVTAARALARAVARAVARLLVRLVLRLKNADILDWSFCFLSIFLKSVGCYACSLGWLSSVSIGRRLSVLNCQRHSRVLWCHCLWLSKDASLDGPALESLCQVVTISFKTGMAWSDSQDQYGSDIGQNFRMDHWKTTITWSDT